MCNQLEKYLSQIEKQLAALPIEQRQDELREIRSHLEMMIEENVASGFDADEAVAKALKQFGAADKLGRDLKFPPGSNRRFLQKYWFRVFRFLASMLAASLIVIFSIRSGLIPYFPSISPSLNSSCILVVTFLLSWTIAVLNPSRKRISLFDLCVTFCCTIATLAGIFLSFTSFPQFSNNMTLFTVAAMVAGEGMRHWQKMWQSTVAN